MEIKNITIPVQVFAPGELDAERARLVDEAREATAGSYAPYSHFHVGAAIQLADGTVVRGANQENAAFSSGTCAERSACFAVGANHKGVKIKRLAVAARKDDEFQRNPISPCGACRQALLEYEALQKDPIEVLLYGAECTYVFPSVASLLPLCFTDF